MSEILVRRSSASFGDVRGNRNRSTSQLAGQSIAFVSGKSTRNFIDTISKIDRLLPHTEFFKPKHRFFLSALDSCLWTLGSLSMTMSRMRIDSASGGVFQGDLHLVGSCSCDGVAGEERAVVGDDGPELVSMFDVDGAAVEVVAVF